MNYMEKRAARKKQAKVYLKRYELEEWQATIAKLQQQMKHLQERSVEVEIAIYSADNDVAITTNDRLWHRIVCQYEGDRCIGGPRIHWTSRWDIKPDGFHLKSMMLDDHTAEKRLKGWLGQYNPENDMKYDELPRNILTLHHNAIVKHIQTMGIWYPCHLYNDFTGEMYRP